MKISLQRAGIIAGASLLLILLSGCIATDGGYYGDGYGNNVGIGLDYYEPIGGYYGGWGRGYNVGPPRGGDRYHGGGPHGGTHPYHSASAGHSMPSIPHGSRSSRGGH